MGGSVEAAPPGCAGELRAVGGEMGGEVVPWDDQAIRSAYEDDESGAQYVIVDALFGTGGLTRAMPEDTSEMWHGFMSSALGVFAHDPGGDRFVAVDFPSGICSDSGKDFGGALPTHLTVTFHRAKVGHYAVDGCENYGGAFGCNKVVVKDIGIDARFRSPAKPVRLTVKPGFLGKVGQKHKFTHGHALILSGGSGKGGGAGRLAARGALRIGAGGLVTVGGPTPGALQENAARLDAVMLSPPVKDADTLGVVLQDERINALCLGGPGGLGGIERARELVPVALAAKRATVLDADALSAYADDPLFLFDMLHDACVLTPPHAGGEFARLFPDLAGKLNADPPTKGPAYSKVDATREAAARAGCVVLFKGADTVIAAPDGRCSVNSAAYERAAPWLATAGGSGDVLAGFITGLLARGQAPPMAAAEAAAWLHVECALAFGPPGLIAEDLPEQLPKVFRKLGL